jgi:hypothetical protein
MVFEESIPDPGPHRNENSPGSLTMPWSSFISSRPGHRARWNTPSRDKKPRLRSLSILSFFPARWDFQIVSNPLKLGSSGLRKHPKCEVSQCGFLSKPPVGQGEKGDFTSEMVILNGLV